MPVQIADRFADDEPDRLAMRIEPRTLICGYGFRTHVTIAGARFEELRQLCEAAGDKASLALAMAGLAGEHLMKDRLQEAFSLVGELMTTIDQIGDPALTVRLGVSPMAISLLTGDVHTALRWSQLIIDLADGDPAMGNYLLGSPLAAALASRSVARWTRALPGWRDDLNRAVAMGKMTDPMSQGLVMFYTYGHSIAAGVMLADDNAVRNIEDAIHTVELSADDLGLGFASLTLGMALVHRDSASRQRGFESLTRVREMSADGRFYPVCSAIANVWLGLEVARRGDRDSGLVLSRDATEKLFSSGLFTYCTDATSVLVDILLIDGDEYACREAEAAATRLESVHILRDWALRDLVLLRLHALIARARGDRTTYRDFADRYHAMATSLGFEGHMKWAEAMP